MHCPGSRWEVWDRARHLPCSDWVSYDWVALDHRLVRVAVNLIRLKRRAPQQICHQQNAWRPGNHHSEYHSLDGCHRNPLGSSTSVIRVGQILRQTSFSTSERCCAAQTQRDENREASAKKLLMVAALACQPVSSTGTVSCRAGIAILRASSVCRFRYRAPSSRHE